MTRSKVAVQQKEMEMLANRQDELEKRKPGPRGCKGNCDAATERAGAQGAHALSAETVDVAVEV